MMPLGDVILGISYGVVTTFFLLFYSTILKVVHMDRELGKSASHRIMFHLGCAECVVLSSQYSMAILAACGEIFSDTLKMVLGAWAEGSWYMYVPLTTLLALNRCVALCANSYASEIFSNRMTTIFIAIGWQIGGFVAIVYLTPLASFIYIVKDYGYSHGQTPSDQQITDILFWFSNLNLIITGGMYMAIIGTLCYRKWKMKSFATSKKMRYEFLVFLQAFLISGYLAFITYIWHFFAWLQIADKIWCIILVQYLYVFSGGVNPLIYLAMSKKIRHDFLNQLRKYAGIQAKSTVSFTKTTVIRVASVATFNQSSINKNQHRGLERQRSNTN